MTLWNTAIDLFLGWIALFIAPFKNLDILWIAVPIYLSWFFAELYQEKKGTSFGNAISNGIVMLWVGIDWMRTLFRNISSDNATLDAHFWLKASISIAILAYGFFIVINGIKAKKFVHYIGRVRVTTYFLLVFTPLFYEPELFGLETYIAIFLFAPLFYFIIYLIDLVIPDPKIYEEDEKPIENKKQGFDAGFDDPFKQPSFQKTGQDPFGEPLFPQSNQNFQQTNFQDPGYNFYKRP